MWIQYPGNNIDFQYGYIRVFCGTQTSIWYGTTVQAVQPKCSCSYRSALLWVLERNVQQAQGHLACHHSGILGHHWPEEKARTGMKGLKMTKVICVTVGNDHTLHIIVQHSRIQGNETVTTKPLVQMPSEYFLGTPKAYQTSASYYKLNSSYHIQKSTCFLPGM